MPEKESGFNRNQTHDCCVFVNQFHFESKNLHMWFPARNLSLVLLRFVTSRKNNSSQSNEDDFHNNSSKLFTMVIEWLPCFQMFHLTAITWAKCFSNSLFPLHIHVKCPVSWCSVNLQNPFAVRGRGKCEFSQGLDISASKSELNFSTLKEDDLSTYLLHCYMIT